MSKYTITIRELINQGYTLPLERYPIFNEGYRELLNWKIQTHFVDREIGYESPQMFLEKFELELINSMPVINLAYKSFEKVEDILSNNFEREVFTSRGETTGVDTSNGSTNGSNVDVTSNTPVSKIYLDDEESGIYATNVDRGKQKAESTNATTSNQESLQEYERLKEGRDKSFIDSINETRNLSSVDDLVFNALEKHFMQLF